MSVFRWLLFVFCLFCCIGCQKRSVTTLSVQNSAQELVAFDYALITRPYNPADSTTWLKYHPSPGTKLTLELEQPQFLLLRPRYSTRRYLLLLAPREEVVVRLLPLGYTVSGSHHSQRIAGLYDLFQRFNDTLSEIKHRYEWQYSPEVRCSMQTHYLAAFNSLRERTRRALIRFIAQEPYSLANLLALEARCDSVPFFGSPDDTVFRQDILNKLKVESVDTLLIQTFLERLGT